MNSPAGGLSVESVAAKPANDTARCGGASLRAVAQGAGRGGDRPGRAARLLELDPALLPAARRAAAALFGLRVPRAFLARMRRGDPRDPLLRQVLPLGAELQAAPGFPPTRSATWPRCRLPGLLGKYRGRALLMTTGACAVHCRYCFRREFPYESGALTPARLAAAVDTLAAMPDLEEVILSGGDPLALPTARLARITRRAARAARPAQAAHPHPHADRAAGARRRPAARLAARALPWRTRSSCCMSTIRASSRRTCARPSRRWPGRRQVAEPVGAAGASTTTRTRSRSCRSSCSTQACCPITCTCSTASAARRTSTRRRSGPRRCTRDCCGAAGLPRAAAGARVAGAPSKLPITSGGDPADRC
jgi:hypothetical protein